MHVDSFVPGSLVDPGLLANMATQDWSSYRVTRRNGASAPFAPQRIAVAISKAFNAVDSGLAAERVQRKVTEVTNQVLDALTRRQPQGGGFHVEEIQDQVELALMRAGEYAVARAYVLYREQHAQLREIGNSMKAELIDSYLDKLDWQVSENANMAYSLQGLNNFVASEVTKTYWLERIYPREIGRAHKEGDFHIHDLNLLAVYCVGWDLADLLTEGFRGAPGKCESRPARHFRAALGQIVNFFYTLQGEAAGAQAFSSLDTYLAPFIRHDKLEYREVKQALQEFVFNLNVPTRVGFQTPFTNITLDLEVPGTLKDEAVILGGERQDQTYGEFQAEMDLFNRAFLEVMAEGDAKGRVFTFPIPTYNITREFNYDDPRLDKLWEVTARYGIPYFANFVNSELSPEDARSMCCRLRLDTRKLAQRGGGLFGANPLTGSIGVVTLNLPRLGHVAKDEADFFGRLDKLVELAAESLELKRKVLERLTDRNLYPYAKFYLRSIRARTGEYWHNHFSTIGLVGMNEAAINLLGEGIDQEKGRAFGLRVLDHLRDRLSGLQETTGHFYNLEATPAEGTSYRLAMLDKKLQPGTICANETAWKEGAEPYYSNSSQLPVDHSRDIFAELDHQDDFQSKYTGGTVQHVFVGEAIRDARAVKAFVRTVFSRYRLPYVSVTPTFSICPEHGYLAGEISSCPTCHAETEVYSRVVGYLRPVRQWNAGKQAEFVRRASFAVGEDCGC
jgi:ribonucleoside-triphosphate reductase